MTVYAKGATLERSIKARAEAAGHLVVRAAGSRGSADLIVFRTGNVPLAINVKIGHWPPPEERYAMLDWYLVDVEPIIIARLKPRLPLSWRLVNSDGIMQTMDALW